MIGVLFSNLKGWLMGALAVLVSAASAYLYLKGRSDGANSVERKADEALKDDVQSASDIRDDVDSLSPSALDKRLSKWTRKG